MKNRFATIGATVAATALVALGSTSPALADATVIAPISVIDSGSNY